MSQFTQSKASLDRLEQFLQNLLDYVNHRFQTTDAIHQKLQANVTVKWMNKDAIRPKLMVHGKLEFLLELTKNKYDNRAGENLKHDFQVLEKILEVLEDFRIKKQGSDERHFSLTLWDRHSIDKNLSEFRQLWELCKSNNQTDRSSVSPPNNPEAVEETSEDLDNSSSPASCIINGNQNIGNNFGTVNINNNIPDTSARLTQQTKEVLTMDILKNIQNMDARLDLVYEALAPDFFLSSNTAMSKVK